MAKDPQRTDPLGRWRFTNHNEVPRYPARVHWPPRGRLVKYRELLDPLDLDDLEFWELPSLAALGCFKRRRG